MIRIVPIVVAVAFVCASCGSKSAVTSQASPAPPTEPSQPGAQSDFAITTGSLPLATASVGYRAKLAASGGTPPYVWAAGTGSLPEGLILDDSQGVITGIPASATMGNFELQVEVEDAAGQTATKNLTLVISAGNWATTYYVDSLSGKDSSSGTSESAAWQTIAQVNRSQFSPGDQILFKRGDTWREELQISSSGTASEPILIGAYGSGPAPIINGADLVSATAWRLCTSCPANVWQAPVTTQPNVVSFDGTNGQKEADLLQLTNTTEWYWAGGELYVHAPGNPGQIYQKPGVEAGSRELGVGFFGISHVTVEDLVFVAVNGSPTNGAVYAQGSAGLAANSHDLDFDGLTVLNSAGDGFHLEDCNNCIVQNSTVSGMARAGIMLVSNHPQFPVSAGAVLGNTVSNNHFDGISTYGCAIGENCEGALLPQGEFLSGLIISGNTVHDNGAGIYIHWTNSSSVTANTSHNNTDTTLKGEGYGIGVEASSHNTIERNLLYSNRTRGIELSNDEGAGTGLTGASYNLVQYNAIHDDGDHGIFTNDAPTQADRFLYNVIWNHPNGECFIANGTGHAFYGNTCWNSSTGVDLYTSSTTPTTANIIIENNIFAKNVNRAVHIENGVSTASIVFDYNDYTSETTISYLVNGQAANTVTWQSMGFDIHSLGADPQFVSSSPQTASDFVVLSSSPILSRGVNLGMRFGIGLSPGSSWPSSVQTAPQGTQWSMGAFLRNH